MRIWRIVLCAVVLAACSKADTPQQLPPPPPVGGAAPTPIAEATGGNACPATGKWAACSLIYHLGRAGLAVHVDSGAAPETAKLGGEPLMLEIGSAAVLELHVYRDSTARITAAKQLDRSEFVGAATPQTMKRERTLIQSVNVIGLLTSINDHLRERVSDAITAGPPQPAGSVPIANPSNP